MGKQSRRKKTKGSGKSKPLQHQNEVDTRGSSVLERLRHADARTRHAALAALHTTILDPESLSKRIVKLDLLQSIRERIMDDDLECAQVAASCLANYVSFGQQEKHLKITASWIHVLLQRLKTCAKQLIDQPSNRWLALSMQCLHVLCRLIETNMQALEIFTQSDAIPTIQSFLQYGAVEFEGHKSITSAAQPLDMSHVESILSYAARTLHSALDDNHELLNQWTTNDPNCWGFIQACITNEILPATCRLHCAGCLVSARLLSSDSTLQTAVIGTVIPLLQSILEFGLTFNLADTYVECHKKWMDEEADGALEREVILAVNRRREPARSIARRQKATKMEKMKVEDETKNDDDVDGEKMKDDVDREKLNDDEAKDTVTVPGNARDLLEEAREAWHNQIQPIELALEIVANLTSFAPQEPEMDGGLMDGDWGADEEVMIIAQQEGSEEGSLSSLDVALIQAVAVAQIPARLMMLLAVLCKPHACCSLSDVQEDIEGLQSKCGACLGNCVSEHFPDWTEGLFLELRLALETTNGNTSIANALLAAMKSRSQVRKQCQASDLEFLLRMASSTSCQKEAIEMLGILCSTESHPEDINRKVCNTLISIDSNNASVINEVLNALMDIYGNDSCHPSVFRSYGVMECVKRTIPKFKRVIQCDRDEASQDVIEQWTETAFNATRFVAYKQKQ